MGRGGGGDKNKLCKNWNRPNNARKFGEKLLKQFALIFGTKIIGLCTWPISLLGGGSLIQRRNYWPIPISVYFKSRHKYYNGVWYWHDYQVTNRSTREETGYMLQFILYTMLVIYMKDKVGLFLCEIKWEIISQLPKKDLCSEDIDVSLFFNNIWVDILVMINLGDCFLTIERKFTKQKFSLILFYDDLKSWLYCDVKRVFGERKCFSVRYYR